LVACYRVNFTSIWFCKRLRGGTALQAGRPLVRFAMASVEFFIEYDPGVDSASNRNEYQEYFLVGKDGRCVGLTVLLPLYSHFTAICEPETPGALGACSDL
jgi:hypothetical protein